MASLLALGNNIVLGIGLEGKLILKKMMEAVLDIAFEQLCLHKVSLGVFNFITFAIACYENVGFVKEGLLRESKKVGDTYWDLWEMSMSEYEWNNKK